MYNLEFDEKPLKFFRKLDKFSQERIGKKIEDLKENPHLGKPLVGRLSGLWKLRVGKYRVIYKIVQNKLLILVLDIGYRKNIYS